VTKRLRRASVLETMQRLIRSFNTLTDALKETLQEQYPDGIDTTHIKTIPTAKGEVLRVIELLTADAMYLIKINPESREEIEQFLDQDDGGSDDGDEMERQRRAGRCRRCRRR
jgi:uncharacterized protein with gpF-like domain